MKALLLFILPSFLLLHVQAQPPQDPAYYVKNPKISTAAKDYYAEKYKASDDARTLSIMDSLETNNNSARPFYIYLVSKMMKHSDGALSEALDGACRHFIEWHPDEAIAFLYSNKPMASPEFIDSWAKILAGEFRIDCEGKEQPCIKTSLDKATARCNAKNRKGLKDLYARIVTFAKPR